jgi:hypothetical protein
MGLVELRLVGGAGANRQRRPLAREGRLTDVVDLPGRGDGLGGLGFGGRPLTDSGVLRQRVGS